MRSDHAVIRPGRASAHGPQELRAEAIVALHDEYGVEPLSAFEALLPHYKMIVPEHPGYGQSAPPSWLEDVHDLAYHYLDLLEEKNLRRVHLVGFSLGGWIAAEIAIRSTERLASLTLVGALGLHVPDSEPVDGFLCSDEQRLRHRFADPALAEAAIARELRAEREDLNLRNQQTTALLTWHPRNFDPQLRKWLHRIRIPTLLVWGAEDALTPVAHGEAFRALIPGAELAVVPQCGHAPHLEQPAAFADLLDRLIQSCG